MREKERFTRSLHWGRGSIPQPFSNHKADSIEHVEIDTQRKERRDRLTSSRCCPLQSSPFCGFPSSFLVVHCSILDFVRACAPFVVVDSAAQVPIVSVRHPHRRRLVPRSRLLGGGDHGASPRWRRAFQRRRHQPWLSYGVFRH